MNKSFFFGFVALLFYVDICYSADYTFKQIKELLSKNSIDPADTLYKVGAGNKCTCSYEMETIGNEADSMMTNEDVIVVYPAGVQLLCNTNNPTLFAGYRVMLNESKVNMAMCKSNEASRDLDDAKAIFAPTPTTISSVIPTTTKFIPPTSDVPADCSSGCVDLIKKIPKGDKGDRGEKGDKGEKGEKGESSSSGGSINGISGVMPKRYGEEFVKYRRTYSDIAYALKNYTGCDISQGYTYLWYSDINYPTYCKSSWQKGKLLKELLPTQIRTGYVILWFYGGEDFTLRSVAYRTVENDIVPVICYFQWSPVFLSRMDYIEGDRKCALVKPPVENGVEEGESHALAYAASGVGVVAAGAGGYFAWRKYGRRPYEPLQMEEPVGEDALEVDVSSTPLFTSAQSNT